MIGFLVLGAGGAVPTPTHSPAAYWVTVDEHPILLDPGPGALVRLIGSPHGPDSVDEIETVLLTHMHIDHCADLVPLLPQGSDIGLHVVVARAAAGAVRLSMDPLLRRIQELNTPDIALSCPPTEGPLLGGAKPRSLPRGRAQLCTRRGGRLIQTALVPAPAEQPGSGR